MAVYTWNFKAAKDHKLVVEHPFSGPVVVTLDGKNIKESSSHQFTHTFDVEGKSCELKIAKEVIDYGIAKMESWVHTFSVDGVSIQTS